MGFEYSVNSQIRSKEVRLIDENGNQVGVVPTSEAIDRANDVGLDLVAVNEKSTPPVCKIIDYGKFRYELTRKEKEIARKARAAQASLKEVHLRPNTDQHDIRIKARRAQEFLEDGDKVKVSVKFKGREINYLDIGRDVLDNFLSSVGDYKFDKPVTVSDRQIFAIIAPASKK